MKPIDFRNATFDALRAHLVKKREAVWLDWIAYEVAHRGYGATTREVSDWAARDILAFRPRCTELYQIGVLMLVETPRSHEGRYRVRTLTDWQAWHAEQQHAAISRQQQLL